MAEKHRLANARKTWRKLHIGLDPESGHIVTSNLTSEHGRQNLNSCLTL
ncbi:conserved hypothetical protein [Ruegeria sp. TrichCH4B]|nr:conserved hypothetical protein [Ruegeria sp. TrichCH4B]